MKYLHRTFKEALPEDGNCSYKDGVLSIGDWAWTLADIVDMARRDDGSNLVFDSLFSEWLEEWKKQRVEEAEQILTEYDQHDRFRRLVEAHRKNLVIPFVGAGMSIPSGYPGWTQFLRRQRKETLLPELVFEELLRQGRYEEAAQHIANEQGPGCFNESIDSAFACHKEVAGPVGLLPYIFPVSAVTTNFDDVLERCFKDADAEFEAVLVAADCPRFRVERAEKKRLLLKLHGSAESCRGRVLTQKEYDTHYKDASVLTRTVKALYDSNHLLFLGCSIVDDRLLTAFRSYVQMEGHDNLLKHYAFLPAPQDEGERIRRKNALGDYHIYPIWYSTDRHDESIEALLIKLHEDAQS